LSGGRLVLAVDGGNTKTLALIAERGRILGTGAAGASDIHNAETPGAAIDEVAAAAKRALEAAAAAAGDVAAAHASVAGADWPSEIALYARELGERVPVAGGWRVTNDAIGAIWCATDGGVGASIVWGTGTAVGARAADGRSWHLGFLGYPYFAEDPRGPGLDALVRSHLGLLPKTLLSERVLSAYGCRSVPDFLELCTGCLVPPGFTFDRFRQAVLDCASEGDALCLGVIEDVVARSAGYVRVGMRAVGLPEEATVVVAGGLLRHPTTLLFDALVKALPQARVVRAQVEPIAGVLRSAFSAAGNPIATSEAVAMLSSVGGRFTPKHEDLPVGETGEGLSPSGTPGVSP
jgi:N-acetylglucosamine kinase-like BadF-type ATPase